MHPPDDILALLCRVRSMRFEARSGAGSGWDGVGTGSVAVSEPAAGAVVFDEAGTWRPSAPERAAGEFTNVFRWSAADGGALRLEHLRYGVGRPVLLFDLAPDAGGAWRSVGGHQCRDDCYTASLGVEAGRVAAEWAIVGPRKRESIRYVYGQSVAAPVSRSTGGVGVAQVEARMDVHARLIPFPLARIIATRSPCTKCSKR